MIHRNRPEFQLCRKAIERAPFYATMPGLGSKTTASSLLSSLLSPGRARESWQQGSIGVRLFSETAWCPELFDLAQIPAIPQHELFYGTQVNYAVKVDARAYAIPLRLDFRTFGETAGAVCRVARNAELQEALDAAAVELLVACRRHAQALFPRLAEDQVLVACHPPEFELRIESLPSLVGHLAFMECPLVDLQPETFNSLCPEQQKALDAYAQRTATRIEPQLRLARSA